MRVLVIGNSGLGLSAYQELIVVTTMHNAVAIPPFAFRDEQKREIEQPQQLSQFINYQFSPVSYKKTPKPKGDRFTQKFLKKIKT